MIPATWPLVPAAVDGWLSRVNSMGRGVASRGEERLHLPEVLAELHNEFEKVHPFIDGNGRVGRLLLNLLLVRWGYPPVHLKRQRQAYLTAMQRADRGEYGPLGELLARGMFDNLNRFILPSVAGPARLVPIASLVDSGITLVALRAAARRGRLDAEQDAQGQWLSTRRAVDAYKESRQQQGRNAPT